MGAVGEYSSLALDSNDNPHISYNRWTNRDLKYAHYDGSWNLEIVDSEGEVGKYTSLVLDSNNNPHISYYDSTNDDLKYTFLTCPDDIDCDGVLDNDDNCTDVYNPSQEDTDEDGIGDACDNCPNSPDDDIDNDNICNDIDNCLTTPNGSNLGTCIYGNVGKSCTGWEDCGSGVNSCSMNQEDTYPPQGNGIGDACDCESDFDCSGSVDSLDVEHFLWDFGRSQYNDPCTNERWCYGDFLCDGSVDAADVTKFLEDFGRSEFFNPCPACEVGDWCVY